jgi:hypothetical protein
MFKINKSNLTKFKNLFLLIYKIVGVLTAISIFCFLLMIIVLSIHQYGWHGTLMHIADNIYYTNQHLKDVSNYANDYTINNNLHGDVHIESQKYMDFDFFYKPLSYALYFAVILAVLAIIIWLILKFTKSFSYPDNLSIITKSDQEIQTEQHNFLIKHVVLLFRIRLLVVVFVAFAIGYYLWHLFEIITNTANNNISAMLLLKQNLLTPTTTNVNDNIQTIINNKDKLKNFYYLTEKEFIATITLTIFAISGLAVLIKMFLSPMSLGTKQNDSDNKAPDYARITGKINNDIPTNDTMSALNSFVQSVTKLDNNHEKE